MKIIIDGKEIETEERRTILEVAHENNIYIPSLCDHSRLAPFTGCRLCIVEIKGRKGFPPSCGTYVEEGMEIKSTTPRLQKLRRQILELILSEHPNACLICDEKEYCDEFKSTIRKVGEVTGCVLCSNNGRCELQDVVEALKIDKVSYPSVYRNMDVKKGDPFFDRNYNLCVLCGRCVRICDEVRGAAAVSFIYRGTQAMVGTVLDRPLLESGCQFCGACVDICPTGALAERGLKYETLAEDSAETVCAFCGLGCTLRIDLKKGRILSSQPAADGVVNRGQACLRGRFLMRDLVHNSRRIKRPLIKRNKEFEEAGWEEVLEYVAQKLKKYKGKQVALISSAQLSCEDTYLFYRFAKSVLKTKNIHSPTQYSPLTTLREIAERKNLPVVLNFEIDEISEAETIFLIHEDITVSHPIIWLEILEAVRRGAKLIMASPLDAPGDRFSSLFLRFKPGSEFYFLAFLSKAVLETKKDRASSRIKGFASFKKFLEKLDSSQSFELTGLDEKNFIETANLLLQGKSSAFLFGAGLSQSDSGKENLTALWNLALQTEARIIPVGLESNLRGLSEIEKYFGLDSLSFHQIQDSLSSGEIKALYLAGPIPEMKKRKPEFLVIQDSYLSENARLADVVLPAATFMESEGITVNIEGRVQKLEKIIEPQGEARPDWWIISRIAQQMGHSDFRYRRAADIVKEMRRSIAGFAKFSYPAMKSGREIFIQEKRRGEKTFVQPRILPELEKTSKKYPYLLLLDYSLDYYRNLSLPQEIKGLRMIRDSRWIKISAEDADELHLEQGDTITVESREGQCKGIVRIYESLAKGTMKACFLWNENSDFSGATLSAQGSYSSGPIPVRIKKGK